MGHHFPSNSLMKSRCHWLLGSTPQRWLPGACRSVCHDPVESGWTFCGTCLCWKKWGLQDSQVGLELQYIKGIMVLFGSLWVILIFSFFLGQTKATGTEARNRQRPPVEGTDLPLLHLASRETRQSQFGPNWSLDSPYLGLIIWRLKKLGFEKAVG